jgi:hypothetical protein
MLLVQNRGGMRPDHRSLLMASALAAQERRAKFGGRP